VNFYKKEETKVENGKFSEIKIQRKFLEILKLKVVIFRRIKNIFKLLI